MTYFSFKLAQYSLSFLCGLFLHFPFTPNRRVTPLNYIVIFLWNFVIFGTIVSISMFQEHYMSLFFTLIIGSLNGIFKFRSFSYSVETFNSEIRNKKTNNEMRQFVNRLLPRHVLSIVFSRQPSYTSCSLIQLVLADSRKHQRRQTGRRRRVRDGDSSLCRHCGFHGIFRVAPAQSGRGNAVEALHRV